MEFAVVKVREVGYIDEVVFISDIQQLDDSDRPVRIFIGFIVHETEFDLVISSSASVSDFQRIVDIPKRSAISIQRFDINTESGKIYSLKQ